MMRIEFFCLPLRLSNAMNGVLKQNKFYYNAIQLV